MSLLRRNNRKKTPTVESEVPIPEVETMADSDAVAEAAELVVKLYQADPLTLGGDSSHSHQAAELPNPARRAARQTLAAAIVSLREALDARF